MNQAVSYMVWLGLSIVAVMLVISIIRRWDDWGR